MPNISDVAFTHVGTTVLVNTGLWIRLVNNSTGTAYVSTAVTDANGIFQINNVPSGDYTVYTGTSSTGPWTVTTDTHYQVPPSNLNYYNVMDYGAKGDGVTDDATAIQNAINAAGSNGVVLLSPLTYVINSALTLPAGVTLSGYGTTIKTNVTVADPNTGNKSAIVIGRGANAKLFGVIINGNSTTGIGVDVSGYNDGQIQNLIIRDVEILNCTVAGLQFQGSYRTTIDHCKIHNNQIGVLVPTTVYLPALGQFDFVGCWIHDNTAEGVKIAGPGAGLFNFHGGNVENNGTYGFNFVPSTNFYGANIVGVDIEQNGNYTTGIGLLVQTGTSGINVIGSQFVGNASNAKQWKPWQVNSGASYVRLSGNLVQGHVTKGTMAGSACFFDEGPGIGGAIAYPADDYLTAYLTTAGTNFVEITPAGGDNNVQIRLTPKGTQNVYANGPFLINGTLTLSPAISQLVPGATSFSIRDTANANDNLLVSNAGAVTVRNGLTVSAGGISIVNANVTPSVDNQGSIGTTSLRWNSGVFGSGGLAVTSGLAVGSNAAPSSGISVLGGVHALSGELAFPYAGPGGSYGVYTSADTGSPTLYFDHAGTGNTGLWKWRNGTGGGNTQMTLSASGVLTVNGGLTVVAGGATITAGGLMASGNNMTIDQITITDAKNIVLGTTTGTQIGTATTQKIGFYGTTPVVQVAGSTDVLAGLVTLGLRAASSNPPLNLGTGAITSGAISATGNITLSGTIGNVAATATMGATLKKGSGAGNYSTASVTYADVDATNLGFTVTIPTGWKLAINASGQLTTNTAVATASVSLLDGASTLVEAQVNPTVAGTSGAEDWALNWVITGDGASHTVKLQYKTSNGADSAVILNSSATLLPTMTFLLLPSN